MFRPETQESDWSTWPPQYIEVPPNIEVKQIVSQSSTILSSRSNRLILKNDSELLILQGCLAENMQLESANSIHMTVTQVYGKKTGRAQKGGSI
jgi:hypothetical protein